MQLVLASRNQHKLRELEALLRPHTLEPLPDEVELPPEGGATFAENALVKARAAALATGRASIADDSGIIVRALDGAPGIRSARYAGKGATDEQNLRKLIGEMRGKGDRCATYVCALALVEPSNGGCGLTALEEHLFEGRCEGRLAERLRGTDGFGYDPIFIPDQQPSERERTMAELSQWEKDVISHRGAAARLILKWLAGR